MGLDFIRARAKTFKKSWDRHRLDLSTRTLFTRDVVYSSRAALATATDDGLEAGTPLIVRCRGDRLIAYIELMPVAEFINPPPDLINLVREGGGCAVGTVVSVQPQRLVEIEVC